MDAILLEFAKTFGAASAVVAVLGWIIRTQRADLAAKDEIIAAERKRSDSYAEKLLGLAVSMESTVNTVKDAFTRRPQ